MEEYSNDKVRCIIEQLGQELKQDQCAYKIPNEIYMILKADRYKLFCAKCNDIVGQKYVAKIEGENSEVTIQSNAEVVINKNELHDKEIVYEQINRCYESVEITQSTKQLIRYKVREEVVRYVNSAGSEKYYIGWIAVCDKDASLVEQYLQLVILKLLTEIIDKMDYFEQEITMIKGRVKETRFNFVEWYTDTVFEKMGFDTIIAKLETTKSEFIRSLGYKEYEKRQCCSSILFYNEGDLDISDENAIWYLVDHLDDDNKELKAVLNRFRKALEICSNRELYLAVDKDKFEIKGIIKEQIKDAWVIAFIRKGEWLVKYDDEDILHYSDGTYYIPDKETKQIAVGKEIRDELSKYDMVVSDRVIEKLEMAFGSQKHGALLIICNDAMERAETLCYKYNRGVQIKGLDIKEQDNVTYLEGMLSVDGAVLMTTEGICHGFGVILDGEAKVRGRDDRGARYNSAVNYIKDKQMLAIIQSEDKENGVDVIYGKSDKLCM